MLVSCSVKLVSFSFELKFWKKEKLLKVAENYAVIHYEIIKSML